MMKFSYLVDTLEKLNNLNVDDCVKTYKAEEQNVKVVFVTVENLLAMQAKNFKKYFLAYD